MQYLSTTRLASKLQIERDSLVKKLMAHGYLIIEKDHSWKLTEAGSKAGGRLQESNEGYSFILWPEEIDLGIKNEIVSEHISNPPKDQKQFSDMWSSSRIAEQFGISAQRLNLILAEIGWIKKHIKGWEITNSGKKLGGIEHEIQDNGAHYVTWPKSVLENRILVAVLDSMTEEIAEDEADQKENITEKRIASFREKTGSYRTKDGHWVRSRAEVIIDDALYDYGIAHAYERKLPVEEEAYSDFYIPSARVFIEFWGLENNPDYVTRKTKKIEIYKKNGLSLIELSDKHLVTLDDHLPRMLLTYGIRVY